MKIKKIYKNLLKLILTSWLAFAFVLWEFNPINWSENVRFLFILSPIIYLLVSGVLLVLLELKDEIKKGQIK